jgi:phosphate-selective porin OprO/OprP
MPISTDRWFGALCALAAAVLLLTFDPQAVGQSQSQQDLLTQLEDLYRAQQQRISALEAQLAESVSEDAARVELMRQQIREILSEQEFREKLAPSVLTAGYDKGFFLRSSDNQFLMKVNGRMQFRWTHYATRARNRYLAPRLERDDRTGFDVRRLRLVISGHAYTPDLTYLVETMADSPTSYDPMLLYAWVNYRFIDEFQFRGGLMQLAGTRATFQSSANMQFADYPTVDFAFTSWTGVGARFWGQLFKKRVEYYLDVVNSLVGPNNRTITPDGARELDNNPAIAFRAVWHALGENPTTDFVDWGDVSYHENPALDLGFHYLFNDDQGDLQTSRIVFKRRSVLDGGFGVTTTNGCQINQFGWDAAFKYRGFSISGEYFLRIVDPRRAWRQPFAPVWLLTGEESTVANHGAYVQTGYFLPIPGLERKLEVVARIQGLSTNIGGTEGTWSYGGGVNYYMEGNKVKLQAEVEKISEVPLSANSVMAEVNDDALIFRVQLQVAF